MVHAFLRSWWVRGVVAGLAANLGWAPAVANPGAGAAAASAAAAPTAPADPPPLSLTLEQALTRGESANGPVRLARAERKSVAARQVGAGLLFPSNPTVAVSGGRRREPTQDQNNGETNGTRQDLQYALHIEQTLEIANQRGVRQVEVARAIDTASWREALAIAETRARVRTVYVGALLAQAQARSARNREALVEQLVDGVRARVDTGAASNVDLQLAHLERGRAARERVTAELAVGEALSDLRALLAVSPGFPLTLTTPLRQPQEPAPLGTLLARAREQRAELRALESSQATLDATVVRLRREALPNPTLFLDLQRERPGERYIGAGLSVPLPVWRRHQAELAVSRAERGRLDEEEDIVAREIAAEVERTHGAVLAHARMAAIAEAEILPAAEASADLVIQGWRAGKFDLFRVIQASREASDARRGQLESLGALWEASIALDRATGTPGTP